MFHTGFSPGRAGSPTRPARGDGPLAPELYEALRKQFGRVQIKKAGELVDYDVLTGLDAQQVLRIGSLGELYYFRCPFCSRPGDDRLRAWASYYYGQPHPVTGLPMTRLVQCWNEACFSEPGRDDEFELRLMGVLAPLRGRTATVPVGDGSRRVEPRPSMPGVCVPLAQLGAKHPAAEYAARRGFDVDVLSGDFGVVYCLDAPHEYRWALNRLVVPVRRDGGLVGWQARRIDEVKAFKYYTMPGWSAGDHLYNFDVARQGRCVVLAEGVFDVWSVGRQGVALFGKDVSTGQFRQLSALAASEPLLVLLLDPKEERERAKAKAKLDPLFPDRVLPVVLPARPPESDLRAPLPAGQEADAGSMTTEAIWAQVAAHASGVGIRLGDYL